MVENHLHFYSCTHNFYAITRDNLYLHSKNFIFRERKENTNRHSSKSKEKGGKVWKRKNGLKQRN